MQNLHFHPSLPLNPAASLCRSLLSSTAFSHSIGPLTGAPSIPFCLNHRYSTLPCLASCHYLTLAFLLISMLTISLLKPRIFSRFFFNISISAPFYPMLLTFYSVRNRLFQQFYHLYFYRSNQQNNSFMLCSSLELQKEQRNSKKLLKKLASQCTCTLISELHYNFSI